MEIIGTGYIVDCNYIINVKDYMKDYPTPRRRLRDCDGSRLPIIGVDIGRCQ